MLCAQIFNNEIYVTILFVGSNNNFYVYVQYFVNSAAIKVVIHLQKKLRNGISFQDVL